MCLWPEVRNQRHILPGGRLLPSVSTVYSCLTYTGRRDVLIHDGVLTLEYLCSSLQSRKSKGTLFHKFVSFSKDFPGFVRIVYVKYVRTAIHRLLDHHHNTIIRPLCNILLSLTDHLLLLYYYQTIIRLLSYCHQTIIRPLSEYFKLLSYYCQLTYYFNGSIKLLSDT